MTHAVDLSGGREWASAAEPDPPTFSYAAAGALLFFRRNRLLIGLIASVCAVALFAAGLLFVSKYAAIAMISVEPRPAKVIEPGGVISGAGLDNNAIDSLPLIAKSDAFQRALVTRLGWASAGQETEALERLGRRLAVARRGASYVLEIKATAASAQESADIANTAAQLLIEDQSGLRSGASEGAAKGIKERIADIGARVARAEAAAAEMKVRLKVTDTGQGSTLLERRVSELNQQLVLAIAKTAEARARLDQLRIAAAREGENLAPSAQSSVLTSLRVDYERLSQQASQQTTVLGPMHPDVIGMRARLALAKRQLVAEIARMTAAARTDLLEAEQREAALRKQLKQVEAESAELGPELVKLAELEQNAKVERKNYDQLLVRQRELADTRNLDPKEIRIVSQAQPPTRVSPGLLTLAAASMLLGLVAGVVFAAAREAMRRTVRTVRQAEADGRARVRAVVGRFDGRTGAAPGEIMGALAGLRVPDGYGAESGALVLVTSARRGEGRSTVARQIAAGLARGDEAVLLVEADSGEARGQKPQIGLSDVVAAGASLRGAVRRSHDGDYGLLPFGGVLAGQQGLNGGRGLHSTLETCRQAFDYVVVDGPPCLESDSAAAFAAEASRVVVVVDWDRTSRRDLREAMERLGAAQAVIVFNKVDAARYRLCEPAQGF